VRGGSATGSIRKCAIEEGNTADNVGGGQYAWPGSERDAGAAGKGSGNDTARGVDYGIESVGGAAWHCEKQGDGSKESVSRVLVIVLGGRRIVVTLGSCEGLAGYRPCFRRFERCAYGARGGGEGRRGGREECVDILTWL
jgi:hypothetical protein